MEKWNTSSSRLHSLGRDNHVAYASGLVPKNFDRYSSPPSTVTSPERLIRRIGEFDIGIALHNLVALIADGNLDKAEEKIKAIKSSSRWRMSYGKGTDTVAHFMFSAALEMVEKIKEGRDGIVLASEQKVMASNKDRKGTSVALTTEEGPVNNLIRDPLENGDEPLVPLTVQSVLAENEDPFADDMENPLFFAYGIQAIPDLLGFHPKSEAAQDLIGPLLQLMYQDNEGTRRFLLNPKLLKANKEFLQKVLKAVLQKELEIVVFEMKTAPFRGSSVTDKPEEVLYRNYSNDISHTILALLQIFKATSPNEFKGRRQLRTLFELSQGTSAQLGLVDFPAVMQIAGQIEPIVPLAGSVKTRLYTIPSEKVRAGCIRRMDLNEQHLRKMHPPVGFTE